MPTHNLTLYRHQDGSLSFYPAGHVAEVPCELSPGYRIAEGAYDHSLMVFSSDPGKLGMSLEAALKAGVIKPL